MTRDSHCPSLMSIAASLHSDSRERVLGSESASGLASLCQVLTPGLISCGRGVESFGLWPAQQVMWEQIPVGMGGGQEVGATMQGRQTDGCIHHSSRLSGWNAAAVYLFGLWRLRRPNGITPMSRVLS